MRSLSCFCFLLLLTGLTVCNAPIGEKSIPAQKEETAALPFEMTQSQSGQWVITDRNKVPQYEVFLYDNGPDDAAEGLIRVVKNGKIGYADAQTYALVIAPRFDCAYPFEKGKAKVSQQCKTVRDGDHRFWESDHWQYIDKKGNTLSQ